MANIYGYARVSTKLQNLSRQVKVLEEYGIIPNFIFADKYTGGEMNREDLNRLLSIIKPGDTIVFKEIDRLGRDRQGVKTLIMDLLMKDVNLVCLDMPYFHEWVLPTIKADNSFNEIIANLILDLLLEVAANERRRIVERTKEGLKRARSRGAKIGKPVKYNYEKFLPYYNLYMTRQITVKKACDELNICKKSFYNYCEMVKADVEKRTPHSLEDLKQLSEEDKIRFINSTQRKLF